MKNFKIFILIFLLILFALSGCTKKVSVSSLPKENNVKDQAAFNYLFSEGVKQKLIGNLSDALKYFEQCILINPANDATFYEMAEITVANGDMKSGKKYAKKAIEINEQNIWYLSLLAGVYYQEKNLDSCIIYYNKALSYFPDKENLRLELATIYTENKEYRKSIDVLDYLKEKLIENQNATVLKVKDLMLLGDYNAAEKIVLTVLDKFPDEILYNGILAEIYGARGETDKALIVYNNLLNKDPGNSQVQISLIEFLQKEKQYDDLVSFLSTVMINSNISKEDKASILLKLYDDSTLVNNYSDNLELTIILLETQYKDDNVIMLLRPELYQKEGRLAEAISKFDAYVKRYPDNYFAWERLLLLFADTKDYEKLVSVGRECSSKFNMSILAKLLYASGATEMKDYPTALDQLKRATILANEDKDILTQILSMEADVYYRMGDYKQCFARYDELLKIFSRRYSYT